MQVWGTLQNEYVFAFHVGGSDFCWGEEELSS